MLEYVFDAPEYDKIIKSKVNWGVFEVEVDLSTFQFSSFSGKLCNFGRYIN